MVIVYPYHFTTAEVTLEDNDQDKEYTLNVSHVFCGLDGKPILTEPVSAVQYKAGEEFTVNAQTQYPDTTYIKKDIDGYTEGHWHLGMTKLEGGEPDSFIGDLKENRNTPIWSRKRCCTVTPI